MCVDVRLEWVEMETDMEGSVRRRLFWKSDQLPLSCTILPADQQAVFQEALQVG